LHVGIWAGLGRGGVPGFNKWFRGPAAFFAGMEWQTPNPRLSVKVEYSLDAYTRETVTRSIFTRRSPFNFGVDYRLSPMVSLGGYYMYAGQHCPEPQPQRSCRLA